MKEAALFPPLREEKRGRSVVQKHASGMPEACTSEGGRNVFRQGPQERKARAG